MHFSTCRFLFDERCAEYKYYEYQLAQEEKALAQTRESQVPRNGKYFNIFSCF